jgi:hypothetical protein
MNDDFTTSWQHSNQQRLAAALDDVRRHLEAYLSLRQDYSPVREPPLAAFDPESSAIDAVSALFRLSPFERDVLVLCAGVELESDLAGLCAEAHGDSRMGFLTFGLAMKVLPDAHWSALSPAAPLRRWQLVSLDAGASLTLGAVRIDERVLHYLVGVAYLDERLSGVLKPVVPEGRLAPSHRAIAEQIAAAWTQCPPDDMPVVQLYGSGVSSARGIAAGACDMLGVSLAAASAYALPASAADLDRLTRLWSREAARTGSAMLIEIDQTGADSPERDSVISQVVENVTGGLVVSIRERRRWNNRRPFLSFEIERPTLDEQRELWAGLLGGKSGDMERAITRLVSNFSMNAPDIEAACVRTIADLETQPDDALDLPSAEAALWNACRQQARPGLEHLAQRIQPKSGWDALVLPEEQKATLRDIAAHVRQRYLVYEKWGFAARTTRGLGISALFSGPSGTGKTMAAEVLANELELDLYRIDLSAVVSKYIGETEKNLRSVFDGAEEGGAVLLFDEADALFGKRSEVSDSHDRYANIEVSYLLQRMEAYRGLAILTTNMKDALDTAFLRRIRFMVQFSLPDFEQRVEIWRRAFPPETPTADLDVQRLAQPSISGASIANIALGAAFQAAEADAPVDMTHVLYALRAEYTKLDRTLTDSEIRGWT